MPPMAAPGRGQRLLAHVGARPQLATAPLRTRRCWSPLPDRFITSARASSATSPTRHDLPRARGPPLPLDVGPPLDPLFPLSISQSPNFAAPQNSLGARAHRHQPCPHTPVSRPCTTSEQAMVPPPRDLSFLTIPATPTPAAKLPRCARLRVSSVALVRRSRGPPASLRRSGRSPTANPDRLSRPCLLGTKWLCRLALETLTGRTPRQLFHLIKLT